MADDPTKTDPPEGGDDAGKGAEETYWKKLENTIDARIDEGIERAIKKHATTGASRTGKPTFPQFLADLLLGK